MRKQMKLRRTWLVEFCLGWTLLLACLLGGAAYAQASQNTPPQTTQVTDTVYRADGTAASGTVLVSWPAFTAATGASIPAGSTSVTIAVNGALSVNLVPNAGSTPIGSYYTVVYHLDDGSVTREYWVVPTPIVGGTGTVTVAAVRNTVLPTSVAMQTVSKAYVDTAIATAVAGHPLDSSPYVLKTGDTMTGPLVLPADPTTPLQASDKNYVDTQVTGLESGLNQKVSLFPQATQVVAQPTGTTLAVNNLNATEYASQYQTGAGNNGIANATQSSDCAGGCHVTVEQTYPATEPVNLTTLTNQTIVDDKRGGGDTETSFNPRSSNGANTARSVTVDATESAASVLAATGSTQIFERNQLLTLNAFAGGSNEFPQSIEQTPPYGKSTYQALDMEGFEYTPGQHVLYTAGQKCYGVGDCIIGGLFITSSLGLRDGADEGTHPFDTIFIEDPSVFDGTCAIGCTPGSTSVQVNATANPGTQGEGRFLIDTNPAKTITTGSLIGGAQQGIEPSANFAGTSFPVSTLLQVAVTIPSQANNIAPGTVTVPITTSGAPAGFASNTAALAATTGVACVEDQQGNANPTYFETAIYSVVDGTHLQLTLNRPHAAGTTVAVGGLCGYGLEQTVDTQAGIRQVFPVLASTSANTLLYAGGATAIVGQQDGDSTSSFANISLVVASIARTGGVVSVTIAGALASDVNGLPFTVQGVTDPSYNGTFTVTTTGPNTLTYADAGPDSTSAGGTLSYLTGGYVLYPMAEVRSVYNPLTRAVDGLLTLAANTVLWAPGDTVEEPHYFQGRVSGDEQDIEQMTPRPTSVLTTGVAYNGNNGPGLRGFSIENNDPATSYFGNGGTHIPPSTGLQINGVWKTTIDVQAGEDALIHVRCNSHGCGRWDSAYNLFQLDSNSGADGIQYAPASRSLNLELGGSGYQFTPQAFTAGTINAGTLNAGTIHGTLAGVVTAGSLPVFAASGAQHQQGAVPDPGPTAGISRYLREDGTWSATNVVPQAQALMGQYLINEGSGTTAHDSSGAGNDAVISGYAWEGSTDLDNNPSSNSSSAYVQFPSALNTAKTWMIAFYQPPFGTATYPQAPGYQNPGNLSIPALLCGTTAQHPCFLPGNDLYYRKAFRFYALGTDGTEAGEALTAGWHTWTLICGSNSGGVVNKTRYLFDGQEVGGYVTQGDANTCGNPVSGNFRIGASPQYSGTEFFGKVAGVWAWNTQLSVQDGATAAKSAFDYIHSKGVPTGYRGVTTTTPVILAGLDSRTYGIALTPSTVWPATMNLTDPSYTRVNVGFAGQSLYDACQAFDLTYPQQAGTGPVITVLWGGVNDFQINPAPTMRQIANSYKCLVQKAKQLGRVVVATEISGENNGNDYDPQKNALDAILRAEAFGWGADNIADLATDPLIGADGASTNTFCFPIDQLHPGVNCEPHITAIMQDAVNELIGSSETNHSKTAAASYMEVAGDRFLELTGSSAQAVTLLTCTGKSLPRTIFNFGSAAASVGAMSGQTLTGSADNWRLGHGRCFCRCRVR